MTTRAEIVAIGRSYLNTPYGDRGRQPGLALDCVGVLVCAAREGGLVAPDFDVPPYLAQPDGHTLMEWALVYLGPPVAKSEMQAGDVIVVKPGERPQHLALLGDYKYGGLSIIHASNVARPHRVIETRLMFSRAMIYVAAFSLPGIE